LDTRLDFGILVALRGLLAAGNTDTRLDKGCHHDVSINQIRYEIQPYSQLIPNDDFEISSLFRHQIHIFALTNAK